MEKLLDNTHNITFFLEPLSKNLNPSLLKTLILLVTEVPVVQDSENLWRAKATMFWKLTLYLQY